MAAILYKLKRSQEIKADKYTERRQPWSQEYKGSLYSAVHGSKTADDSSQFSKSLFRGTCLK